MIRVSVHRFGAVHTLLLEGLLAIGLVASTAIPTLAQSGTWKRTGSMKNARFFHTATLLQNGKVLVAGGNNGTTDIAAAELYDPSKGTWTVTGNMAEIRNGHTATLLQNGEVLVAGGSNGNGLFYASAELYNPSTGTWRVTGSMNAARIEHTATLLPSGKVLVAGGGNSNSNSLASAELYDPSTGNWTPTGSMNDARTQFTATLLNDGQVLAVGFACSTELYDPSTGTWTLTGSLNQGRYAQFAMLLANGQALVLDGHGNCSSSVFLLSSAELYNPSTGTWTLDGNNGKAGNTGQSVTLVGTGMVLSAGGTIGAYPARINVIPYADLFDPSTGNDVSTGSMVTARHLQTATLLPNGQVLVAGGQSQKPNKEFIITNTAELYTP